MPDDRDMFDEEREQPAEREEPSDRSRDDSALTRRRFLRRTGAAAAAGALIGVGGTIGVGALLEEDEPAAAPPAAVAPPTDGPAVAGMTLGVPAGRPIDAAIISLNVNGEVRWVTVLPNESLADVLRRRLGLTGTKIACDRAECGSCTVLVDGTAQNGCSLLAIRESGKQIITIEGLERGGVLSPVQQAFVDEMALQCGFCTPGMIMQSTALLEHNASPTEGDVRQALSGNFCKCDAYSNILAAVLRAAESTN